MKKLLHERLRECAVFGCDAVETAKDEFEQQHDGDFIKYLADEIERCYIPRPQDKEGRPWNTGDDVLLPNGEENNIEFILCDCDGLKIGVYDGDRTAWYKGDECSRPTPKVYDADGVDIKRNDRVYPIEKKCNSDTEGYIVNHIEVDDGINSPRVYFIDDVGMSWMKADQLTHERPVFDANGERIKVGDAIYANITSELTVEGFESYEDEPLIWCGETKHGIKICYIAKEVSHREPDSFNKAMERFQSILEDKDGLGYETEDKLWEVHKRLTALIERGA